MIKKFIFANVNFTPNYELIKNKNFQSKKN